MANRHETRDGSWFQMNIVIIVILFAVGVFGFFIQSRLNARAVREAQERRERGELSSSSSGMKKALWAGCAVMIGLGLYLFLGR